MRDPDWDRLKPITPPDNREVECKGCLGVFDVSDCFEIRGHWECSDCAEEVFEEDDDDGDE